MGYMGCAWAALGCYSVMMVASYIVGRIKYPIGYETGRLCGYFLLALGLWGLSVAVTTGTEWIDFAVRTALLIVYLGIVLKIEQYPVQGACCHVKRLLTQQDKKNILSELEK